MTDAEILASLEKVNDDIAFADTGPRRGISAVIDALRSKFAAHERAEGKMEAAIFDSTEPEPKCEHNISERGGWRCEHFEWCAHCGALHTPLGGWQQINGTP